MTHLTGSNVNNGAAVGPQGEGMDSPSSSPTPPSRPTDERFIEVLTLIHSARQRAVQAVNTQLIELYWQVGAYISHKLERADWGDAVVSQLADYLAQTQPGLRGFTRSNLFRMRQFYEVYRDEEKVAPLARQLSWSHNMIIFGQSKHPEEREFYLRMAIQEKWSKRELERQFKAALFERSVLTPAKVTSVVTQTHPASLVIPIPHPVIPAKAGIHASPRTVIPAKAGIHLVKQRIAA